MGGTNGRTAGSKYAFVGCEDSAPAAPAIISVKRLIRAFMMAVVVTRGAQVDEDG